eukprot:m.345717 g.345717  ORF g.345717 m.345717 type:complete len:93 (+) comp27064_c0_seq1:1198-1476(+)
MCATDMLDWWFICVEKMESGNLTVTRAKLVLCMKGGVQRVFEKHWRSNSECFLSNIKAPSLDDEAGPAQPVDADDSSENNSPKRGGKRKHSS